MKSIYLLPLFILSSLYSVAQNVGINQTSPTNSLHISPVNLGDNPLRIDGVQTYSVGDTSLLMINTTTGIVKYINPSDFVSIISGGAGLGTDDQNIDSLTLNGLTLTTFIENGNAANIDLTPVSDSAISYIINNSDTLFSSSSFIDSVTTLLYNNADTLLSNSTFINNLRDSVDTDVDSVTLTGTTLTIYENGSGVFVDLSALSDADADPQNEIQDLNLTGNNLTITNNSTPTTIDLSPYLDNTDAQTLSLSGNTLSISNGNNVTLTDNVNDADSDPTNEIQTISKSGSTVTLSNGGGSFTDDDTQLTEAQVDAYANNNGYLTSFTEVDGSVTNEIQNLNLSGDVLSISSGNTVNLGSFNDHDWYEDGGSSQPDNISDNIYTNGNVGIIDNNNLGTLNPSEKYLIISNSTNNASSNINMINTGNTDNAGAKITAFNGTNTLGQIAILRTDSAGNTFKGGRISFQTVDNADNVLRERVVIQKDGNVGIGISNPSRDLVIGNSVILLSDADDVANVADILFNASGNISAEDNLHFLIDVDNNNPDTRAFIFGKNNEGVSGSSELARLNELGRFGIGTTTPDVTLDVNGLIRGRLDTYRIGGSISSSGQCYACQTGDYLISAYESCLDNCGGNPCDADLSIDLNNNRFCAGSNDMTGWCAFGICLRGSR